MQVINNQSYQTRERQVLFSSTPLRSDEKNLTVVGVGKTQA